MYKLIACDLDETLYTTDRRITQKNREAIAKAKAKGVKFVPATGRGYMTVGNTLTDLDLLDKENEYVISFNGGALTENKNNRLMFLKCLDFDKANILYQMGTKYDVCIHAYTRDTVYCYNIDDNEIAYLNNRQPYVDTTEKTLDFLKGQDIVKVLYTNTNYEYLKSIREELGDLLDGVDVSYSSNRYIEFNALGVTKGSGLRVLSEMLGIKREETIAIGDNLNDLSMILEAGLGVGVANTIEEMKPKCGYITKATNNEDAIAEVIEKFIL